MYFHTHTCTKPPNFYLHRWYEGFKMLPQRLQNTHQRCINTMQIQCCENNSIGLLIKVRKTDILVYIYIITSVNNLLKSWFFFFYLILSYIYLKQILLFRLHFLFPHLTLMLNFAFLKWSSLWYAQMWVVRVTAGVYTNSCPSTSGKVAGLIQNSSECKSNSDETLIGKPESTRLSSKWTFAYSYCGITCTFKKLFEEYKSHLQNSSPYF